MLASSKQQAFNHERARTWRNYKALGSKPASRLSSVYYSFFFLHPYHKAYNEADTEKKRTTSQGYSKVSYKAKAKPKKKIASHTYQLLTNTAYLDPMENSME